MMQKKMIMILPLFLALSACSPVKPWQRDSLALPQMSFDTDPMESGLRLHTSFSKEAASGGYGGSGGGCGCN